MYTPFRRTEILSGLLWHHPIFAHQILFLHLQTCPSAPKVQPCNELALLSIVQDDILSPVDNIIELSTAFKQRNVLVMYLILLSYERSL